MIDTDNATGLFDTKNSDRNETPKEEPKTKAEKETVVQTVQAKAKRKPEEPKRP